MLKIWGRANSSNVVKVMWCVGELGLAHERLDWGGRFGGNDEPRYSTMNPMKRVPTLEEADGFTLWESHAIVRYLSAKHSPGGLFPDDLRVRAEADKWMDWSSLYLQSFNFAFRMHLFVLPEAERKPEEVQAASDTVKPLFGILDQHLADRAYLCGEDFTMGDIPAGSLVHRWLTYAPDRPTMANLEAYYDRLKQRPAFVEHVMGVSPGD